MFASAPAFSATGVSSARKADCALSGAVASGVVAGVSRVCSVICASGRSSPTVPNHWRRFLYTKTPPAAGMISTFRAARERRTPLVATTRGDDDASTLFHPDCTVGPGFSPDLLRQKASLAGLACYTPYRRSGIAPCPEGHVTGLPTREETNAGRAYHAAPEPLSLSYHDRVYSTQA